MTTPYPEVEADLDDFLAEGIPAELLEVEPPEVPDPYGANILLRRLARLERSAQDIAEMHDAEVARIDAWAGGRLAIIEHEASWIRLSLKGFMFHHNLVTGDKTLDLPNGTLKVTKPTGRIVVDDPHALLEWAKANDPDAVKVTESVLKSKVSAKPVDAHGLHTDADGTEYRVANLITDNGEQVPGIHTETAVELRFTASPEVTR
jgi:hypothetical protein